MGTRFQFPVDHLWLSIYGEDNTSEEEPGFEICFRILAKEPNLIRARRLDINGDFSNDSMSDRTNIEWESVRPQKLKTQRKVFFNYDVSNGVASNDVPRFHRVEELRIQGIILAEIPELITLKKLDLNVDGYCALKKLNKLCNLEELRLFQIDTAQSEDSAMQFKLPNLRYLKAGRYLPMGEDLFDEFLPSLKILDLSDNPLTRIPKLANTSLKELHISIEGDSLDLKNLSTLTDLKKLVIIGDVAYVNLNTISQLQKLEYLKLKRGDFDVAQRVRFKLDKLPQSLRVLSLYGIRNSEIIQPIKLKKLKFFQTRRLVLRDLSAELSILEVTKSTISEIKCDVSWLPKIELSNEYDSDRRIFTFNDKTSFHQEYEEFIDYCELHGIKYDCYNKK